MPYTHSLSLSLSLWVGVLLSQRHKHMQTTHTHHTQAQVQPTQPSNNTKWEKSLHICPTDQHNYHKPKKESEANKQDNQIYDKWTNAWSAKIQNGELQTPAFSFGCPVTMKMVKVIGTYLNKFSWTEATIMQFNFFSSAAKIHQLILCNFCTQWSSVGFLSHNFIGLQKNASKANARILLLLPPPLH